MPTDRVLNTLSHGGLPTRIWAREPSAFVGPDLVEAASGSILNRLGWLTTTTTMPPQLPQVEAFAATLEQDGLTDVYLLGMGGSSLCAEVLRDVLSGASSASRLVVLDTTDETAIGRATDALVPERSCFLVASKSGSTLEVTSLEQHFWSVMARAVPAPGRHFAAITDPNTALVAHAAARGYRHTFINPPDIGGRYSALSLFGLVPARLVGIAGATLLGPAAEMAEACRADATSNPGLALGAFMGAHALDGRDKLTLLVSPPLAALGVWIEQLVAESTGKHGRGVLPVVDEPVGSASAYGSDRAFVIVMTPDDRSIRDRAAALEAAGHPVFRIESSPTRLGAEFFRWEFATAVAGAVLGVNPFDEPDVRGAKVRTQAQLDARRATGAFAVDPPFERRGLWMRRESASATPDTPTSYIALLDYLPSDPGRTPIVAGLRTTLRKRTGQAATHGLGPRYLHSTGQYHKGGPNTGRFVLITATDRRATPIPGMPCTFSVLKQAQAFGDFDALKAAGRHVIHYHLDDPDADPTSALEHIAQEFR
jgi:glucose-6-phosphate isomerase